MENRTGKAADFGKKIIRLFLSNKGTVIGTILGGVGGFIYYQAFGCSGSCTITSNPWLSIVWGAVMGYLLGSTFKRNQKSKQNETEHGNS